MGNWRIGLLVEEPVWPILRRGKARGGGFLRGGSGCVGCLLWWDRVGLVIERGVCEVRNGAEQVVFV